MDAVEASLAVLQAKFNVSDSLKTEAAGEMTEQARKDTVMLLDQLADWVEDNCGGDENIARTSGFELRKTTKTPVPAPPKCINLDARDSACPTNFGPAWPTSNCRASPIT